MKKMARKPRTRKEMVAYLKDHFRYYTANGWNGLSSYANCIKITHLGLTSEEEDACLDMLSVDDSFAASGFLAVLRAFDRKHDYSWQIGSNGRSGGYLVLYQGGTKPSGDKSYCSSCGQRNFQVATEDSNKCGRCGGERINFDKPPVTVFASSVGTDSDADFEDWSTSELKRRVDVVWDFDKTCEKACKAYIEYATNHIVEEEIILVEKTIRVAK